MIVLVVYLVSVALSVPACLYLAWLDWQDGEQTTPGLIALQTAVLSLLPIVQWLAPLAAVLVWGEARRYR